MAVSATPPTPERAPISFGAWLGIVLLFLFFGIFVLVLVSATPHGNTYEAKRAEAREKKLNDARNAATRELTSYAWSTKARASRASRSIVRCNLPFAIWRRRS